MKHYRFKDLSITSAKKPFHTHLFWEHSTYGLILVDSGDQTKLFISTDKGDNWAEIDLSDNTNSYKIQAGWLDGNDLWLVMCDNNGTADDFEVCFVELDDSNDCNPIAVSAGADVNTVYAYDIFIYDGDTYVINLEKRAGDQHLVIWDVDTNPFVEKDANPIPGTTNCSYGIVIGAFYYFFIDDTTLNRIIVVVYGFAAEAILDSEDVNAFSMTVSRNQHSMSYDGSQYIYFVGIKDGDGKNYLIQVDKTLPLTLTILAEYNIALMLDRNTASGVLEKGFEVGGLKTYEIKPRRGGIVQLQDLSSIPSTSGKHIIAITDNFIMLDPGDMFEFTEVTSEISQISYTNGIIGIPQRGSFIVHPDFAINWNIGDSIKIYDDNDVLEFWGKIENKNRDSRGRYHFIIDAFSNEIYRTTYENDYSGDDLDTKQKNIIDNGCNFCYRSSSIVGTTTTFDYDYKRAIAYLFYLGRFLERQVPYIEPDGKLWTKAYDDLAKNPLIYPATYDFKDVPIGTSGTSIDFVDGVSLFDGAVEIVSNWLGHRKVLRFTGDATPGEDPFFLHSINQATSGTREFWVGSNNVNTVHWTMLLQEVGVGSMFRLRLEGTDLDYYIGVAWIKIQDVSPDILYHLKMVWRADNTWDLYVDGIKQVDNLGFETNQIAGADRFQFLDQGDTIDHLYVDAWGDPDNDTDYNIGDNEVAWDLTSNTENVFFIDIPNIGERQTGFFDGNTGITRTNVRYLNNTVSTRPVAATRDPIEQLKGIIPLKEFRDPRIEAATEANQLGDNLYGIFSTDTIFLALFVQGQGFLQPGKTIDLRNTGQITVTQDDFVILQYRRDPKNDRYFSMILSDNIIFTREFKSFNDTTPKQIHTSIVQTFENQNDINAHLTREGGLALRLTNKTGGASVKGTIVEAHAATDNAFRVCDADSVESFGVVYEDGIADGSECLVVIGGRVQVLLKDATLSTRNNWVKVSDVAGRADATGASPAAAPTHFKEIGHCIESKGADTDVLAYIILHIL